MQQNNGRVNSSYLKAQSLEKYSSREEVTRKWISIHKRLNKGRNSREYNSIIMEAISVSDAVIQNTLKGDFLEGKFIDNLNKLIERGCPISSDEFGKLKRIKWYRNMGAHNTETVVQEIINYQSAKDTLIIIGRLLFRLGMLSEEDIVPRYKKLQANVGDVIGETCMLQELIGQGGSGRVFKAYHKRLDLTVAVKEIDHEMIKSIDVDNEKKMLLSLRHNGIPRIYDIIEDNQTYYLVMDYIDGQTLKNYIEKMGRLPVNAVLRLAKELCDIMSYLHNFKDGIIFRDLKPSNIMLDRDTHIHLIDFGISKQAGIREKVGDVYSGTNCYSSPEQLNGDVCDKRSDIYSLGGVIYFMTEGCNPAENGEQSYRRSTPEGLINIIEKAMAKDREARYNSIEELAVDIDNLQRCLGFISGQPNSMFNQQGNDAHVLNGQSEYRSKPKQPARSNKKIKLILLAAAAAIVVFIISRGIPAYNKVKDGAGQYKSDGQASFVDGNYTASSSDALSQQISQPNGTVDTTEKVSSSPDKSEQSSESLNSDTNGKAQASAAAFNGQAILTVSSYNEEGTNLIVNGVIENNYSEEFTISPYDIYVMDDRGNKFQLDIFKALANNMSMSNIVPGEKREFKFIFSNYKESDSLTLYVSKIYCGFTDETFTLKLK